MEDVFEFRNAEINVEEIKARIRARISERRARAEALGLDYDRLASGHPLVVNPVAAAPAARLQEVARDVALTRDNANSLFVSLSIAGQNASISGRIAARMRSVVHRLVIYYTNMLARKQAAVNQSHATAMSGLLAGLEDAHARIHALQAEVDQLRSDLERMSGR